MKPPSLDHKEYFYPRQKQLFKMETINNLEFGEILTASLVQLSEFRKDSRANFGIIY